MIVTIGDFYNRSYPYWWHVSMPTDNDVIEAVQSWCVERRIGFHDIVGLQYEQTSSGDDDVEIVVKTDILDQNCFAIIYDSDDSDSDFWFTDPKHAIEFKLRFHP
jgi:hypothetical protein